MERNALHRHRNALLALGLGLVGLSLTVSLSEPGRLTAAAGPIRFDAFYAAAYGFGFLLAGSLYRVVAPNPA